MRELLQLGNIIAHSHTVGNSNVLCLSGLSLHRPGSHPGAAMSRYPPAACAGLCQLIVEGSGVGPRI